MAQTVFPTKSNLMQTRKTLDFAKVGFELLDRKRNVLLREVMAQLDQLSSMREQMAQACRDAYDRLEKANVAHGMHEYVAANVPIETDLSFSARSVMGVEIPLLSLPKRSLSLCYPLSSTGMLLDESYLLFERVKQISVELAQVETAVYRLTAAIKKTQKRANALKNIIIPRLTETSRFIAESLEEKEREEFSRMKIIKTQKEEKMKKSGFVV